MTGGPVSVKRGGATNFTSLSPFSEAGLDERAVEIHPATRRHVTCTWTLKTSLSSYIREIVKDDIKPQAFTHLLTNSCFFMLHNVLHGDFPQVSGI